MTGESIVLHRKSDNLAELTSMSFQSTATTDGLSFHPVKFDGAFQPCSFSCSTNTRRNEHPKLLCQLYVDLGCCSVQLLQICPSKTIPIYIDRSSQALLNPAAFSSFGMLDLFTCLDGMIDLIIRNSKVF